ncbi:MAG: hypothetical protein AAFP97_09145 [Pseudomonadota bacterium]
MTRLFLLSAALLASAAPAFGQAATAQPGNCAIWLDEAAKTAKTDPRLDAALKSEAATAFKKFSDAQQAIVDAGMEKTYADSKAFGWDRAKVDAMMAENEAALRQGFRTATMEPDKFYMDHIMAINSCAEINKEDVQFGQSRQGFIDTLTEARCL